MNYTVSYHSNIPKQEFGILKNITAAIRVIVCQSDVDPDAEQ